MFFIEPRLLDNKLQANNVCFPGKKKKKKYREKKSDDEVRWVWH